MNREEALRLNSHGMIPRLADKKLINKIYDDFESRTCESCKYGSKEIDTPILCNQDYYVTDTFGEDIHEPLVFVPKDYGCNKWEARDAK